MPAIHRNRSEVREIFLREMGKVGMPAEADLTDEPAELAGAARRHLREKFMRAKVAISGANFIVADTGTLCPHHPSLAEYREIIEEVLG